MANGKSREPHPVELQMQRWVEHFERGIEVAETDEDVGFAIKGYNAAIAAREAARKVGAR